MTGIEQLAESIEASLADMAEALGTVAGIESGLADLIEILKDRKGLDITPLVGVLKGMNPTIHINVPPAPAPVLHFLPAPNKAAWQITRPGGYNQPDVVIATIKRVE